MNKQTHVATQPNKAPATPIQVMRDYMMGNEEYQKQIANYYKGNTDEAMRFLTASVEYIRKVPKLLECNRVSLLSALMQSAQFNFMPSGISGEAYIIPYGIEANFQLGYQGIVTLLYRTGKVSTIDANIVYAKDEFDYQEGLNATLVHKPDVFAADRGKPIGVYTVVQMTDGSKTFKVMGESGVMKIKAMSKAKNQPSSPWNSKDPELWMWKKTCLIQHSKLLPKTQELQAAIAVDYKGEGLAKPTLDAGGPAVGAALHAPFENVKPTRPFDKPLPAKDVKPKQNEPANNLPTIDAGE